MTQSLPFSLPERDNPPVAEDETLFLDGVSKSLLEAAALEEIPETMKALGSELNRALQKRSSES